MQRLAGRSALVTGGGGLLGAAFCRALAAEGAQVVVNDVDASRADAVAEEIADAGGQARAVAGSVASWDAAGSVVDASVDAFGRIDCLVNAAHATSAVPLRELDESTLRETLDIHLVGHFACTHHATRHMIQQGGGSVVNLVSRAMQGLRGYSAYGAAKGAILSATFTWALELAPHGIRVNALSPAARRREPGEPVSLRMPWRREPGQSVEAMRAQTPTPESVAPVVVYLASDASHWVSGQGIFLAGDSLALIRHPMETALAQKPPGWSVDEIDAHFRTELAETLEHPGMQARPYAWRDGVA